MILLEMLVVLGLVVTALVALLVVRRPEGTVLVITGPSQRTLPAEGEGTRIAVRAWTWRIPGRETVQVLDLRPMRVDAMVALETQGEMGSQVHATGEVRIAPAGARRAATRLLGLSAARRERVVSALLEVAVREVVRGRARRQVEEQAQALLGQVRERMAPPLAALGLQLDAVQLRCRSGRGGAE